MSQEKKEGDTQTEAVLEGAMDGLSFPAGALIVRLADGIRELLIESGFFFSVPLKIFVPECLKCYTSVNLLLTIMHHKTFAIINRHSQPSPQSLIYRKQTKLNILGLKG